ncbi:MAG: hypothetical protein NT093_00315 [Candidatus Moranbacteria bacterium]|nr:hypothetical protein [Candidatus Moranbacteria bacterium]
MDKTIKFGIIAGILIVALSVAYYFVIFIPKRESYKQEQEKKLSEKRTYCNQWALDTAKNNNLSKGGSNDRYDSRVYDTYFERCLREQGISN